MHTAMDTGPRNVTCPTRTRTRSSSVGSFAIPSAQPQKRFGARASPFRSSVIMYEGGGIYRFTRDVEPFPPARAARARAAAEYLMKALSAPAEKLYR
ncbi:hypothetical protein EVAR_69359_1 [Eumeta japonica]|uniref:Uncharacterized protein n=1 Tax=Eumeta variegata TaxID=151549 RepID=A0A4C2A353_EUMVA|nr:hypothetical protein EVAR_69359_1 [Eumeta japonica]